MTDRERDLARQCQRRQQVRADRRVALDHGTLRGIQRAGAQQQVGRHADLAEVVEERGEPHALLRLLRELEPLRDQSGVEGDEARVAAHVAILRLDRLREDLEELDLLLEARHDDVGLRDAARVEDLAEARAQLLTAAHLVDDRDGFALASDHGAELFEEAETSATRAATPERAADNAIAAGLISRSLPFARREAVAAISQEYQSTQAALDGIAARLREFYGNKQVDARLVEQAIRAAQAAYSRNVFPAMQVKWGTYPNHLGHVDTPGCFRCHDDEHKSRDGRLIRQDCELCHTSPE